MKYIVVVYGNEMYITMVWFVEGTKDHIRSHLFELVERDRKMDVDSWDCGTSSVGDVYEDCDDGFTAWNQFYGYHIDYIAIPAVTTPILKLGECK